MKTSTILLLASILSAPALAAQNTHLLVVSGSGGERSYSDDFHAWGTAMVDAARTRFGLAPEQIVYLAEDPARDAQRISGRSSKEEIERRLRTMSGRAGPNDRLLILLIGHGSAESRGARIHLPGPDLNSEELAGWLALFPTQRIVVVNAASASGDFHNSLEGRNRTIITATRSGMERNATVFGRYFVDAFTNDVADVDKDGRITVLEAFDYAVQEVERYYTSQNRLQTENARLEGDREIARGFHLAGRPSATAAAATPQIERLIAERQQLEGEIEALRARRAGMEESRYEAELERLLVEVALKTREIRELEGGR